VCHAAGPGQPCWRQSRAHTPSSQARHSRSRPSPYSVRTPTPRTAANVPPCLCCRAFCICRPPACPHSYVAAALCVYVTLSTQYQYCTRAPTAAHHVFVNVWVHGNRPEGWYSHGIPSASHAVVALLIPGLQRTCWVLPLPRWLSCCAVPPCGAAMPCCAAMSCPGRCISPERWLHQPFRLAAVGHLDKWRACGLAVPCCAVPCCAVPCCAVPCCAVPCLELPFVQYYGISPCI
jgi:hypothetical protein